ncbi:glycosyltransferase family A protein [Rhizobium tumorigenes]|uniref:Glycosyltransferase family A protein n=1 Tax=Rhizobium tumorigenes TaxID=2041385 RepID=A0AAF1KGX1_9HYPH|nr:glycosyltransferase family A protein [Rhizobium tumorigenes]WFR98057.1 glycosyltransferase family A protein [Rhizobium tumorigenes]
MLTAIVIPCLNERDLIPATAASLGFGEGPPPKDTILVLVDNGSKDGTLAVLKEIQQRAGVGLVFVGEESNRGYVPPRAKGNEIATMVADARNIKPDRLLILQADADTRYSDHYVRAFQTAASNEKRSAMFEGTTAVPHRFLDGHPGFQRLADRVDADMARYLVGEDLDVIVDDKVAGYTLSSYQQWGGFRRDYSADGNEIHAETSRLFMRAKGRGAVRVRIPDAEATPSRRKILRNPIRHFATAGFPRDETWWRRWSNAYDGPRDLAAFEGGGAFGILKSVIKAREAHLLGLFSLLPLLVEESMGRGNILEPDNLHPLVRQKLSTNGRSVARTNISAIFDFVRCAVDEWARAKFGIDPPEQL